MTKPKIKLQPGDIISSHRKFNPISPMSYVSLLIRLFTRSWWSHTSMILVMEKNLWVFESTIGGVRVVPLENWTRGQQFHIHRTNEFPKTKRALADLITKIKSIRYDYFNIAIQQPILQVTGKWIGRKKEQGTSDPVICAELIGDVFDYPDAYKLTPHRIFSTRFEKFPEGEDIYAGDGSDVQFIYA